MLQLLVGHELHELPGELPVAVRKVVTCRGGQLVDVLRAAAAKRWCGGDGRQAGGLECLEVPQRTLLGDFEVGGDLTETGVSVRLQKGKDRLSSGVHGAILRVFQHWS